MGTDIVSYVDRQSTGMLLALETSRAVNASRAEALDVVNVLSVRVLASTIRVLTSKAKDMVSTFRVITPQLSVKNPVKKAAVLVKELKDLVKNPAMGAVLCLSKASQYVADKLKKHEWIAARSFAGCFGEKILSPVKVSPKILSPPDSIRPNYIGFCYVTFANIRHSMMW